jgi:hypothetical protein
VENGKGVEPAHFLRWDVDIGQAITLPLEFKRLEGFFF